MGANVGNDSGGFSSEINITPLVDVVLVLLIIFMVIVPVMMRGYDVDVPGEARVAADDIERLPQIVLHVEGDACPVYDAPETTGLPAACTVRLNDAPVAVEALADAVAETYAERAGDDRVLFLAAQPALNYEFVMRILDAARSKTADLKIGLVTEA